MARQKHIIICSGNIQPTSYQYLIVSLVHAPTKQVSQIWVVQKGVLCLIRLPPKVFGKVLIHSIFSSQFNPSRFYDHDRVPRPVWISPSEYMR